MDLRMMDLRMMDLVGQQDAALFRLYYTYSLLRPPSPALFLLLLILRPCQRLLVIITYAGVRGM